MDEVEYAPVVLAGTGGSDLREDKHRDLAHDSLSVAESGRDGRFMQCNMGAFVKAYCAVGTAMIGTVSNIIIIIHKLSTHIYVGI